MSFTTVIIDMKELELIGILDDEQDALDSFKEQTGHICDAINEVADSYIPIYNNDVWAGASKIQDHIEEAIANGLAPTEGEVNLVKIFQAGYYQYYNQSLYNNLDALAFNYIAEKLNEDMKSLPESTLREIDLEELQAEIEEVTDAYDNNNSFSDLDDIASDLLDRIEEGRFAEKA